MPTPRQIARDEMMRRISEIGFAQLDAGGPHALNLRAVARELGVVSSAIYRYVADRDAFLTLLVTDAYRQLADSVERNGQPASVVGIAEAMRAWAIAHPRRWGLIYGTPVVGYAAPSDTLSQGTRVMRMLLEALDNAHPSVDTPSTALDEATREDIEALRREWAPQLSAGAVELAVEAWSPIIGLISSEVFGHFGEGAFRQPAVLFRRAVERLANGLGRLGA